MRDTFRFKNNYKYWHDRWDNIDVDESMVNSNIYPLKNAISLIGNDRKEEILEAGCGNGRLLRYYHEKKFKITGIDFIKISIEKILKADNTISAFHASIFEMPFKNDKFMYVLAFGLYHNFQNNALDALNETNRVMMKDGLICASFRADNFQNRAIDLLYNLNYKGDKSNQYFHKRNFSKKDLIRLFEKSNFSIIKIEPTVNVSFLFKLKYFRGKAFDEKKGRKSGYKLSLLGKVVHRILMNFPNQYCNLYVVYAKKN